MKAKKLIHSYSLAIVRRFFPQVERVVDAQKSELIEVTHQDNSNGAVKSHRTCALAVACKRFFEADGVIIGQGTSYIIHRKVATRYTNNETVTREIVSFDRKAGFDEGIYRLSPPSPASRLGAKHKGGSKSGKLGKRKFRHYTTGIRSTLGHKLGVA
jgi:hypothetical protein